MLSIAAAKLGFAPVVAVDIDPLAVEATRANAAANGVEVEARLADAPADELPAADAAVANVALEVDLAIAPRLERRACDHIRLPRSETPELARLPPRRAARARGLGGRPAHPRRSKVRADGDFSVGFLGCKVSHADAQAVRERLLADGHAEARRATSPS